ncbi:MAG: acyl-CoA desaturase, partial [Planctomycetota bacterium]|nr:acyl-CoA desaturase [Planctomycetota bacterium]
VRTPFERRPAQTETYAKLKKLVKEAKLLEKQPRYFAWKIPFTFALMIPSVVCLVLFDNLLLQILNAVYLAFVFGQITFIGHDAGHRQICSTPPRNDRVGLFGIPFVGIGFSWWMQTHNAHHTWPNQTGKDPAVTYGMFAFSGEQARQKTGFARWLIRYQAFYFLPLAMLYPVNMRKDQLRFFLARGGKRPWTEMMLIVLHNVIYLTLLFTCLPVMTALIFILVHQMVFSIFMVSAFAPNHKGMPVLSEDTKLTYFEHQVITAQNVRGGFLTDIWYGGLNYQIEHHLFPNLPRNRLRASSRIIRPFIKEHGLPYTETTTRQFWFDLLGFMHRAGSGAKEEGLHDASPIPKELAAS